MNEGNMGDVLETGLSRLKFGTTDRPQVYPTGIRQLDLHIDGLRPGTYGIIAGKDGLGKSNIALLGILQSNIPVGLLSAEDEPDIFASRLLSMHSGVPEEKIRRNRLGIDDVKSIGRSIEDLARRPIHVGFPFSAEQTITMATEFTAMGVKMVWYDYIQSHVSEYEEVARFLRQWRELLSKSQSAAILLSQIRKPQSTRDNRPARTTDADIVGNSVLYQKARLTCVLSPEYRKVDDGYEPTGGVAMVVHKNSYGSAVPVVRFRRTGTGMLGEP